MEMNSREALLPHTYMCSDPHPDGYKEAGPGTSCGLRPYNLLKAGRPVTPQDSTMCNSLVLEEQKQGEQKLMDSRMSQIQHTDVSMKFKGSSNCVTIVHLGT